MKSLSWRNSSSETCSSPAALSRLSASEKPWRGSGGCAGETAQFAADGKRVIAAGWAWQRDGRAFFPPTGRAMPVGQKKSGWTGPECPPLWWRAQGSFDRAVARAQTKEENASRLPGERRAQMEIPFWGKRKSGPGGGMKVRLAAAFWMLQKNRQRHFSGCQRACCSAFSTEKWEVGT